ncbi:MAG TPA: transcription termination factor Rho [Chthoniobacterales bacterium]|nr:transcription termination factor Rho [Chthoniobacterales bacterium]
MDENDSTPSQPEEQNTSAAETAAPTTEETAAPAVALPEALNVNELQALDPAEIERLCRDFELRVYPGRLRHHLILDLVRAALGRKIPVTATGFFDPVDSCGVLRWPRLNFLPVPEDVGVPRAFIQQFKFRPAQKISGTLRLPREREKLIMLDEVREIEGVPAEEWAEPTEFDSLTPLYPEGRILLENSTTNSISARAVDLLAPLGRGQRGLIVAAPRVGKTILLKEIAKAIRVNHPEIVLIILLVDERPEEVTDLQREVDCDVYNSTFDENSKRHVEVAELVLERAKRLVEQRKDVVVLLDSITRLARGYNSLQPGKGRTMSGGVEAKALLKPKKFFGAARNCEEGGSLTILATALVDTGSKMDQVIFEEFKGTGNMELHLDRSLVEKRLYPAIHCMQSATRREDLLYHPEEWERVQLLRKAMAALPPIEAMEKLIDNLNATKTNAELLLSGLR